MLKKVLVIDDNADILDTVEIILTRFGFEVLTHNTATGVRDKVMAYKPNVILLDVNLPGGMPGTEICRELRKTFNIPVIFFSAYADKREVLTECDAFAFIPKPFDINVLVDTINSSLN